MPSAYHTEPVEHILWDAYFGRVQTKEEKQAFLRQVQNKYKSTVLDPRFSRGHQDRLMTGNDDGQRARKRAAPSSAEVRA
jgi:hypothetical protein